jgi:replicative DNA helicase
MAAEPQTMIRPVTGSEVPTLHGGVPPHDAEAEGAVLAALLLDEARSYDEVQSFLRPEHFFVRRHHELYLAIISLVESGQSVDPMTVASQLKATGRLQLVGGTPFLTELVDKALAVHNVVDYARRVYDYWRRRQVIAVSFRLLKEAHMDVGDLQRWIEQGGSDLEAVAHTSSSLRLERVGDVATRALDAMRTASPKVTTTATGLVDLDKATGGVHDAQLTVVAARPGMGKTAFICTKALHAARKDIGVAIWSLEMSKEQLSVRILSMESGVDSELIRDRELKQEHWDKLHAALERMRHLPMWIDDTPAVSLQEVRSGARRLQREIETGRHGTVSRLGMVVVDYLQLMRGTRTRQDNREQEIAGLSRGLKELSKELPVPVVAVSQLNRAVEHGKPRRPQLSDLRESGAIEQDADNVWFLYRPGYYDDATPQSDTELIIAKQRNGRTTTVRLHFQESTTTFRNAADDSEFGRYTSDFQDGPDV